ncbi:hypothetical protein ACP70R_029266 [Stipagrostis hirtigluma subsp. patula]
MLKPSSHNPSRRKIEEIIQPSHFPRAALSLQHQDMSTKVAEMLGLPPGFDFRPDDDELVELYLLPRVRGEPDPFPGAVVVEDNTACSTLPWKLLKRHGLGDDEEAYFCVRTTDARESARPDRRCDGGSGTWTSQRRIHKELLVGGEKIKWSRNNLNLHMGGAKSGSTGWVMHEYTLTSPPCPFLKICHITFTGHGQKRQRVPDDQEDEPVGQRARLDAAAAAEAPASSSTTMNFVEGQEPLLHLTEQEISEMVDSYLEFGEQVPTKTELQMMQEVVMPPVTMMQESGTTEHLLYDGGEQDDGDEFLASMGVDLATFCC